MEKRYFGPPVDDTPYGPHYLPYWFYAAGRINDRETHLQVESGFSTRLSSLVQGSESRESSPQVGALAYIGMRSTFRGSFRVFRTSSSNYTVYSLMLNMIRSEAITLPGFPSGTPPLTTQYNLQIFLQTEVCLLLTSSFPFNLHTTNPRCLTSIFVPNAMIHLLFIL